MAPVRESRRSGARSLVFAGALLTAWTSGPNFVPSRLGAEPMVWRQVAAPGLTDIVVGAPGVHGRRLCQVMLCAAKKKDAGGDPVCDGDTVYIKVHTGRYIGEIEGTSRKEWVKARGTKKDAEHALTIEKPGGGEVESGDTIKIVMPLTVTNGTKIHMDIVGSAVRARYYDPRGEWQKMTIVKQEGGPIRSGDKIFIRSVFKNGRDYMDANPLEKIGDGEVKCRWPDEGEWQVMTIEK